MESFEANKEDIQFFKLPPYYQELKCVICLEYFSEPVFLDCNHTLCKKCCNLLKDKKCPSCRLPFKEFTPNTIAKKLIDDLDVICTKFNCNWVGKLKNLKSHSLMCKAIKNSKSKASNFDEEHLVERLTNIDTSLDLKTRLQKKNLIKKSEVKSVNINQNNSKTNNNSNVNNTDKLNENKYNNMNNKANNNNENYINLNSNRNHSQNEFPSTNLNRNSRGNNISNNTGVQINNIPTNRETRNVSHSYNLRSRSQNANMPVTNDNMKNKVKKEKKKNKNNDMANNQATFIRNNSNPILQSFTVSNNNSKERTSETQRIQNNSSRNNNNNGNSNRNMNNYSSNQNRNSNRLSEVDPETLIILELIKRNLGYEYAFQLGYDYRINQSNRKVEGFNKCQCPNCTDISRIDSRIADYSSEDDNDNDVEYAYIQQEIKKSEEKERKENYRKMKKREQRKKEKLDKKKKGL